MTRQVPASPGSVRTENVPTRVLIGAARLAAPCRGRSACSRGSPCPRTPRGPVPLRRPRAASAARSRGPWRRSRGRPTSRLAGVRAHGGDVHVPVGTRVSSAVTLTPRRISTPGSPSAARAMTRSNVLRRAGLGDEALVALARRAVGDPPGQDLAIGSKRYAPAALKPEHLGQFGLQHLRARAAAGSAPGGTATTPSRRQRSQAASGSAGSGAGSRSRTVTRWPSRASIIAAARPQRPPPSTIVWDISSAHDVDPLVDLFPHVHFDRPAGGDDEQERALRPAPDPLARRTESRRSRIFGGARPNTTVPVDRADSIAGRCGIVARADAIGA